MLSVEPPLPSFLRSSRVCAETPEPISNRAHAADARVFMSVAPRISRSWHGAMDHSLPQQLILLGCDPRPRQDDNASRNGIAHVAFDHEDSLRSREFIISWLTPTPHAPAVYASCSASLPPHATLASRRPATALPGPDLHRLSAPAFLAPSFIRSQGQPGRAVTPVPQCQAHWQSC